MQLRLPDHLDSSRKEAKAGGCRVEGIAVGVFVFEGVLETEDLMHQAESISVIPASFPWIATKVDKSKRRGEEERETRKTYVRIHRRLREFWGMAQFFHLIPGVDYNRLFSAEGDVVSLMALHAQIIKCDQ